MALVWKNPIFDRTIEDVEFAIRKITEWKESHTHSTDIHLDSDALVVRGVGMAYATEDEVVIREDGAVYVDDDALVVRIGDVYELKGCLNLLDLNRIEGNIAFLAEKMESYSYSPDIHCKQWSKADLPNGNDMSRIIDNIRALISAYYSPHNPPELPTTMLSYEDINSIEKNLHLIKEMLDWMESSFKKVGTIKSGSKMFLPIRR